MSLADGVLSVTIDRPDSLNSLTLPVFEGLADAIEHAANDSAGEGGPTRRRRPRLLLWRGNERRRRRRRWPRGRADLGGQPAGAGDHGAAATGRRGGSGPGGRYRRLHRLGLRPRIGFGQSVFHARVHQDRPDARRWRLGTDRRRDRSYRGDADGLAGRATARRRRTGRGPGNRGLPGRRLRRRSGQGDLHPAGRPRGGIRQDQARDQRGHAGRVGADAAARARGSVATAGIARLP